MYSRPNPFATSVVGDAALSNEEQFTTTLIAEALRADQARAGWLERQRALARLRHGIRPPKEFPWPGCSNLSIPYADAQVRKAKPSFMRLLVDADPVCEFRGENPQAMEAERVAESLYNWIFKQKTNALEASSYMIDSMCARGLGFLQVGWDYRTELECRIVDVGSLLQGQDPQQIGAEALAQLLAQQYALDLNNPSVARRLAGVVASILRGDPYVKLAYRRAVRDCPAVWDREPAQVILPPRTTDVGNADWVIVQHLMPMRQLKTMAADGMIRPGAVAHILANLSDPQRASQRAVGERAYPGSGLAQQRELDDQRDRIWGVEDEDSLLIWECFCWADLDGDGLVDRTVVWLHPKSNTVLAARPYVFPFRRWPIEPFPYEHTNRRIFSARGIVEMLEGLQREVNAQHNARVDGMTLRNSGTYWTTAAAGFEQRSLRLIPGTILELPQGAQLQPILQDRGPFTEQVAEENMLRAIGEQYIGSLDTAIYGPGGSGDRRTATEIQAAVQITAATATLDAMIFQMHFLQVHKMLWALWLEYGPESVFIEVMGEDALPVRQIVRKYQVAHEFTLSPTGTIANTNHALEASRAMQALQLFAPDQTGLIDKHALYRWFFTLLDYRAARRIMRSPQDAQEYQILAQAAAALQKNEKLQSAIFGTPESPGAEPEPPPEPRPNPEVQ